MLILTDYAERVTDSVATQELRQSARTYGERLRVNPYTALLEEVQWRAGHVAAIRDKLSVGSWEDLFTIDPMTMDEQPSALLKRYDAERTHLDRACKLAIDAGIAERYVQLAELQGAVLYRVLTKALDAATARAGLSPAQLESFKTAFAPALRAAFEQEAQPTAARVALDQA